MPLKRAKSTEAPRAIGEESEVPALETDGVSEDLAKVRDILFGSQFREHSIELDRLEGRMTRLNGELRDEVRAEIGSLERMVNNKVDMISDRFTAEHEARTRSIEELNEKLNELGRRLEAKLAEFEEKTVAAQRDLHSQLRSQSDVLNQAIQQRNEETVGMVTRRVEELRTAKTDRSSLAGLLMDVATRLADDEPKGEASAPPAGNGQDAVAS